MDLTKENEEYKLGIKRTKKAARHIKQEEVRKYSTHNSGGSERAGEANSKPPPRRLEPDTIHCMHARLVPVGVCDLSPVSPLSHLSLPRYLLWSPSYAQAKE